MGPVGTYNISVYNNAKGLAQMNALTNTFTFPLTATSISPTYGGVGGQFCWKLHFINLLVIYNWIGGVKITITGNGFSKKTQVLVDNIDCPIFYQSYQSIICITPPNVIKNLLFIFFINFEKNI